MGETDLAATELKPIRGPSALGGGRRRFFDLLVLMAVSDFKKAYFGTALGYAWSLVRPLMLFGVLLVVFTKIFRIGSSVDNYPVLLLLNIVLFGFFQEATGGATTAVVAQEGIVRKTQFPRLLIPLAVVATALLNLGMNLIAVAIFMIVLGVTPLWTWLFFPPVVAVLFVLTVAVSAMLSALYVRRRDTAIIWSVVSTMLFYGSAVLYPIEIVPSGTVRDAIFLNPLVPLLVQLRQWVIDSDAPDAVTAAGGWIHLLPAAVIFVAVCAVATWVFFREAPRIAELL